MLVFSLLGLVVISQIMLSLFLFLESSRTKRKEPRIFLLVSVSTIFWTICNIFLVFIDEATANSIKYFEVINKVAFVFAVLSLLSIYFFGFFFPAKRSIKFFNKIIFTFGIILGAISPLNMISGNFSIKDTVVIYLPGSGLVLVGILALAIIIESYFDNIKLLRETEEIQLKKQTIAVITGLTLTIAHALFFIIVLPIFLGQNTLIYTIGYAAPLYFVGFTAFALLRLGLFDIRLIVVRSFVYTITTAVLVTIYSGVSLPIKNFLISVNTETYISTIAEIFLLAAFGMSFYPLKLYFDRVTTKHFFRDHYNVQEVLKSINAILSVSIDLDKMLHRVGGVIKKTLLIEHCAFIIDEDQITGQIRYINVGKSVSRVSLPQGIDKLFRGRNVVIVNQLKDEGVEQELKKYLVFQSIAVLVKLRGVEEHGHIENQGYIILGNKKSGKSFSGQDEKMLDILSAQLAVAAQNLVHIDEIVHFNIKLQEEVTDATKELKVKNKKLRELDQTKDEFVSMASHQLRTPLTAIKGYLSMVIEGDAGELKPAQKQLLDQAYMSTQRMVYLIADLLNLSRLKTGKFVITPQPTNLAGMIEGEIHQIEETAKSRGHKVSFMCDPSIPDLMLDDMKTRQVIMNFIDNAIYYTPAGGIIQVSLEQKGGKVLFKVTDNGIGVAKEDQKELFAKFFRAGNARKARPDGTGLGLYMAKMVIDAEGGDLIFSSEVGKGSTFGFSFDISQLKAPVTQPIPNN